MSESNKQADFERLFRIAGETLYVSGYQALQSELIISYKAMMDEIIAEAKKISFKLDGKKEQD